MNNGISKYASDFRAEARAALTNHWGIAILVTFLAGLLGGQSGTPGFNLELPSDTTLEDFEQLGWNVSYEELLPSLSQLLMILLPILVSALVFSLALLLIGPCIHWGLCRFRLALVDGEQPTVGMLFSGFKRMFFKALGVQLMQSLIVFLSVLIVTVIAVVAAVVLTLALPGAVILAALIAIASGIIASIAVMVVLYRYAMSFYALVDNPNMGVMDALRESARMMKGNKWRLFCLQISFIGWSILCLFTCGIGYFWLNPYMGQAEAAFYHEVSGRAAVREAVVGLGEFMEGL